MTDGQTAPEPATGGWISGPGLDGPPPIDVTGCTYVLPPSALERLRRPSTAGVITLDLHADPEAVRAAVADFLCRWGGPSTPDGTGAPQPGHQPPPDPRHPGAEPVTDPRSDALARVFADIATERARQDAKWGVQHRRDSTGGPVLEYSAAGAKAACRAAEKNNRDGAPWRLILAEEAAEAFAEADPAVLREELVQTAAVCVAWIEDIDSRDGSEPITVGHDPVHEFFPGTEGGA